MSSSRLQMQGGTGKMRNRYRVGSDQFLCLYFTSSSHFFFFFLLTVPLSPLSVSLLIWVILTASLFPQNLGGVPRGCFSYNPDVQIQHCRGLCVLGVPLGVPCDSSRPSWMPRGGWRCRHSHIHPGLSCYNGQVPGTILAHIPQQGQGMPSATAAPQIWLEVAGLSDWN